MFSVIKKISQILCLLAFIPIAQANKLTAENYDIYIGDLNSDGAADYYFHQKPLILIIHGDIATPISLKQTGHFAVYRSADNYNTPQSFALTETDVAQKITSGDLRRALEPTDFVTWSSGVDGENFVLLRGADLTAPAILLQTVAGNVLPNKAHVYSTINYPNISNRSVPLRIVDINNDGRMDIVLGAYTSDVGETAYLADGARIPKEFFEVTPATTKPIVETNSTDGISYHVGTVAGEFRVDESGAATYNVPINLPQGVAGVTPQVSLSYSSGAGSGILGKGWSLNAFSTISRCRKTLVHDGKPEPITWTSADRFCLDGQRLILISGSYGAANSTYKTEMDSFTTVTVMGEVLAGTGYFKSVSKDGSTHFFGRTANSRFFNSTAGVSKTLTWAQSRFQDNVGNGVDYIYEGTSADGHRLKTIQYAYSAVSLNPSGVPQSGISNASVNFEYTGRPDQSFSFVSGYKFNQTQRLHRIVVKNDGDEVRRYLLDYMPESTTNSRYQSKLSRLERIRECNGQFNCLMPITFMWGGGSHLSMDLSSSSINFNDANTNRYLLNYFFADVTGNGKQDLVYLMFESGTAASATVSVRIKYSEEDSATRSSVFHLTNKKIADIRLASIDYNADGRQDLALYDGSSWKIYLATPRSNNKWTIDSSSTLIDVGITTADTSFIDVNSDGLADAVTGSSYRLLKRNTEPNTSNKAYSFGSSVNFMWDDISTFPGMTAPLAVGITCGASSYSKRLSPGRAADFNGDGVVDFIGEYKQTAACYPPSAPGPQTITKNLTYALVVIDGQVKNYGNAYLTGTDITPVDINGDGLSDLAYLSGAGNYYYRINNGTGFDDPVLWATLPTYTSGPKAVPQFLDFNGDGFLDVVWHNRNDGKIYVRLWGATEDTVIKSAAGAAPNDSHMVMDVTGDGLYDHLRVTPTSLITYKGVLAVTGAPIPCYYYSSPSGVYCIGGNPNPSVPVPDSEQHTNIYSIDNGLGAVTRINYGTLSNSGRYSTTDVNLAVTTEVRPSGCPQDRGYPCSPTYTVEVTNSSDFYSRLNGGWQLPAGSSTVVANNANKDAPVLEVNGAIQVVTSVESSAPAAGALPGNVSQQAMSKVDYFYGEAKLQASGRGFLGFGTLKTVDAQTNITTLTAYRQDFPFTGKPLSTVVFKDGGTSTSLLSSASNKWAYKEFTGADNTKYYQPYISDTEEKTFDYTSASLLQTITSNNKYDDFGNLTESTIVTSGMKADGITATALTKKTVNGYSTSAEYKKFGRLTSSTVTTTRDGASANRSSTFTYYGASDPNGAEYLLKSEAVNVTGLANTTTTYEYDSFGNKTKTTTQASDTLKAKSVVNYFGATGRYLVSTTNDLQQSSLIDPRDAFGNVKKTTDINQVQSESFHDVMGNEYLRKDDTGTWVRTDVAFCNTTTCPSLAGAKYRVYKRVAGGGKAYEYFDALGRVIRSSKLGFDGWVHVDTEYDNLSRIKRQSVPFSGAAAEYWTENSYDNLGRLISVIAPDGSESKSSYDGKLTTTTNSLSQKRKETHNGLGQLEKVEDHLGGVIEYQYDLFGNLAQAQTTADGSSVVVKICYDTLGRKVAMHDPDKGGFKGNGGLTCAQVVGVSPRKAGWWYYNYNAFGELVEQIDPKGQKVKNYYDQLGRMIGRVDYLSASSGTIESVSQWFYEQGLGAHKPAIKGKLTAVVMNTATGLSEAQVETFINNGTASCSENSNACHKTLHDFDVYGRPSKTTVYFPGSNKPYVSTVQYDTFGRPYRQYDALDNLVRDTSNRLIASGTQTHYNSNGYAYKTTDIATGRALSTTLKTNVLGQVTEELRGNGLRSINTYDIKTGLLTNQKTLNALNLTNVQNNIYGWDTVGNLKYRQNLSGKTATPAAGNSSMSSYSQSESFCYDGLNRLIKTNASTTSTATCSSLALSAQDVRYDGHGNIKYKKDVGEYAYTANTTAGPHAVTSAGGSTYTYDANGNNTSGGGRSLLEYTSYDMVKKISKGANFTTEFEYGPDRSRWQRKDTRTSGTTTTTTTTTYMGNVERIQVSSNVVEWKRNVAGVIYTYQTDNNNQQLASDKRYIYTDHLGSVDLITDAAGEVGGQYSKISHAMSFDAWGARRDFAQWNAASFTFALSSITVLGFEPITRRGFTGHEMVDDMGIIHMNGRIYDPKLGRFLQADPLVDGATNTQGYNRYSYVKNNPLNATDPSGFSAWTKFRDKVLKPIVQAVVSFYCPVCGAYLAAGSSLYYGGSLKQAVIAAFSSYVMSSTAASIGGAGGAGFGMNMATLGYASLGGVMSVLQGGKFGNGFVSAGLGSVAGAKLGPMFNANGFSVPGLIASAVIGGTVSEISGGKFANGASSAAFSYLVSWGDSKFGAGGKPEPQSTPTSSCTSKNPINIATGEKYLTMVDYQAAGASQMMFERYYSSYASEKTSLGIGWRSNFDRSLQLNSVGDVTLRVVAVRHQGDQIMFNWISDESANGGYWETDDNRYEIIRKTNSGWELQLTDNSREIYNAEGRLIAIKQIDGYEQILVYGDQGTVKNVLLSVMDNFGQQLQFAYDLQARMTSMTASDGSVTRYEYDAVDNLSKVISPDETPENKWDNAFVVYDYNDKRFSHAITGIRNSQGQRIHSMAYDESGRAVLSALGDDVERVDMVFSAGENHTKKTLVKNSLGKHTEYTFDQHNKPLVVDGQPTATCIGANQNYEYNDKGQLTSKTDWNGSTTRYEYNNRGLEVLRVEAVDTAEERSIETQWHAQWRLPVQVKSAGLVVEFDYNNAGQLIQRIERDIHADLSVLQKALNQYPERVWSYGYNAQGLLQSVDGPRTDVQDITEFQYDAKGNRTAVINALGHRSEVIVVNERGLPEQVRDANGVVTVLAYSARGWLTHKTVQSDKGDSTTVYHYSGVSDYNNQGLISAVTLPNGEEITYEYDSARRLIAQHNKAGERLEYSLDLEGNRTEQRIFNATGALAFSQTQVFDELSRLLASIGADGNSIGYGYDKAGNRKSTTDALGHKTSYAYDALNRLIATTDALDGEVIQTYDAANRVTSITDQRGLTTQYRYNGFGNKIAQISPDTGETRYEYDEAGNLTRKTDARGVVTKYRYDVLSRVTDVIYPAANDDNIHYRYDEQQNTNSIGRVSSISDASGEQVYGYNDFGQVTEVQSQIGVTRYNQSYDYDRNGQLVAQQYPSGRRVNYHYDAQGRLATVDTEHQDRSENVLTHMRHQPFGPLATLGYGNGTQLEIGQDKNYRIRSQQLSGAANDALYHRAYGYDANSNIVGITDYNKPAANQVFAYDALSRLTDATGSYGTMSYGYDAVGNRISRTQNNRLEDYTYAENSNRLLSVISEGEQGDLTTRTLGYDAVGNITNDSANLNAKILGFGANNRLEQVSVKTGINTVVAAYQYNAKGQRVIKQVDGKTIHFHYDTENRLLAETTETGAPIRDYIYAANQRIALVDYQQNSQGVVYFMVNDHLGTPQLLLDAQQQIVWSVDQSPFGEVKVEGSVEQPLRFPGQYADIETGYSYNYFRDYDPTLGRYIESDPIGLEAGVNTFGYVMGNPITSFDLLGLIGEMCTTHDHLSYSTSNGEGWYDTKSGNTFGPSPNWGMNDGIESVSPESYLIGGGALLKGAASLVTNLGSKLFLSETFGITSTRFAHSVTGAGSGTWNVTGSTLKMGWSGVSRDGGGMMMRIGLGGTGNAARFHMYLPGSFVPNSFANGSIQVKKALYMMDRTQ